MIVVDSHLKLNCLRLLLRLLIFAAILITGHRPQAYATSGVCDMCDGCLPAQSCQQHVIRWVPA